MARIVHRHRLRDLTEVRRSHGAGRVRYRLLSLPLYLVERLPRIVDGLSVEV